jgi:hypothetical protein
LLTITLPGEGPGAANDAVRFLALGNTIFAAKSMVRLKRCNCPAAELRREQRSGWMKLLFPSRRLYSCYHCGKHLLLPLPAHPLTKSLTEDSP